jgi:hypothetical protein
VEPLITRPSRHKLITNLKNRALFISAHYTDAKWSVLKATCNESALESVLGSAAKYYNATYNAVNERIVCTQCGKRGRYCCRLMSKALTLT